MGAKALRDEKGRLLPGQTANPSGRPSEPDELKFMRKRVHLELKLFAMTLLTKTFQEAMDLLDNDQLSAGSRMILTAYEKATNEGSHKHFETYCKVIGFNLNTQVTIRHEDNTETGLEKIPTEKLEKIQEILNEKQ